MTAYDPNNSGECGAGSAPHSPIWRSKDHHHRADLDGGQTGFTLPSAPTAKIVLIPGLWQSVTTTLYPVPAGTLNLVDVGALAQL